MIFWECGSTTTRFGNSEIMALAEKHKTAARIMSPIPIFQTEFLSSPYSGPFEYIRCTKYEKNLLPPESLICSLQPQSHSLGVKPERENQSPLNVNDNSSAAIYDRMILIKRLWEIRPTTKKNDIEPYSQISKVSEKDPPSDCCRTIHLRIP